MPGYHTSMTISVDDIKRRIRDVPDFPKPGIMYRDITPLMAHGPTLKETVSKLGEQIIGDRPDVVVGIESRGFIFGAAVAAKLGVGFVPMRKPGKLPWKTSSQSYALEYGEDALEMHQDAVVWGTRVVVVDDLLATGGTAGAAIELLNGHGAHVIAAHFVVELDELKGRHALPDGVRVAALVHF